MGHFITRQCTLAYFSFKVFVVVLTNWQVDSLVLDRAGVFKVLGVGWELPPNFQGFFYLGGIPPALFYSEVVFGMLLNTVFDLMNITNNYSNYHGVSEKKSQIDHLYD